MTSPTPKLVEVPLDRLDPNPLEPADRLEADPELVESIRALGLIQPIRVVANGKRWTTAAGHRRAAAFRELGHKTIPAIVGEEDRNGVVLVAENAVRRGLDPLAEAGIVAELLRAGHSREAVGQALGGRSVKWVARRANLGGLGKAFRSFRAKKGSPVGSWPAAWLEEIALLDPSGQALLLKEAGPWEWKRIDSIDDVAGLVRRHLRTLRTATWNLDDADLVPAVGSCRDCPKTSCSVALLFGPETEKLEEATCRDARCFDAKAAAAIAAAVAKAKKEHGPAVGRVHGKSTSWKDKAKSTKAAPVLEDHDVTAAKKTDAGAFPAVIVDGPRAGKLRWVKKKASRASSAGPGRPKKNLAQKRAERAERLGRLARAELETQVAGVPWAAVLEAQTGGADDEPAAAEILVDTIARVGLEPRALDEGFSEEAFGVKAWRSTDWLPAKKRNELLWAAVVPELARVVRVAAEAEDVAWILALVDVDPEPVVARIEEENPEPKSWAREEAAANGKPAKKPARKGAKR